MMAVSEYTCLKNYLHLLVALYNLVGSTLPYSPLKYEAPFNLLPKCLVTFTKFEAAPHKWYNICRCSEKVRNTVHVLEEQHCDHYMTCVIC